MSCRTCIPHFDHEDIFDVLFDEWLKLFCIHHQIKSFTLKANLILETNKKDIVLTNRGPKLYTTFIEMCRFVNLILNTLTLLLFLAGTIDINILF